MHFLVQSINKVVKVIVVVDYSCCRIPNECNMLKLTLWYTTMILSLPWLISSTNAMEILPIIEVKCATVRHSDNLSICCQSSTVHSTATYGHHLTRISWKYLEINSFCFKDNTSCYWVGFLLLNCWTICLFLLAPFYIHSLVQLYKLMKRQD